MAVEHDQEPTYVVRHHPRDQVMIAVLAFFCVMFFIASVNGVNIIETLRAQFFGGRLESAYWPWIVLIASMTVFFCLVGGNRRLDIENAIASRKIEDANRWADEAFERIDRKIDQLRKRENIGSGS